MSERKQMSTETMMVVGWVLSVVSFAVSVAAVIVTVTGAS